MSHYFDVNPESEHQVKFLQVRLGGQDFKFKTDHAVFSRDRLDYGSELLMKAVLDEKPFRTGRMLDLGCGYGAIGIMMKRLFPALDVVMCDINERAVGLARDNAAMNQTKYLEIVQSDALAAVGGSFDLILTNPPIRAGKAVVYRFFEESAQRLNPDGRLYVVIRKQQGAPSAIEKLKGIFPQVSVIDRSAGYWVICAVRSACDEQPQVAGLMQV
ncbi:MAG: class I SAM-dependent methyltransferase [Clostridiaceae bacterium]|nr:class I SAM-dependent methyltransferase [Clostridiaceae bacterium]